MDMFSLGHSNQLIDNEYNREPGLECGSEEASQVVERVGGGRRNDGVTVQKQRHWFLRKVSIGVGGCLEGQ